MNDSPAVPARSSTLTFWLWPGAIWLAVTATTLATRPPMIAIDLPEQAAAWWAWVGRSDVPYLSGAGAEAPPLLFWSIDLGWSLFGVSETSTRLAASAFGLLSLCLVVPIARRLWPSDDGSARSAPIILAGSCGFIAYLAATSATWPLLLATVLSLYGIALAWRQNAFAGWAIYAAALALGELAAGAYGLAHVAPIAMAAPLAIVEIRRARLFPWYAATASATVAGLAVAAILLMVTVPATSGDAMRGVVAQMFEPDAALPADIDQPWFWYFVVAGFLLYPWLWWTPLWRAAARGQRQFASSEMRLCILAGAIAFLVALIGGRRTADLLPILPPLALAAAHIWSSHAGKARDFHAAVPGLMALFVCLFFFMLNIIPVAHLDAVWQRLFDSDLPIWFGGISLASGMTLLSGSYLLALLTPRSPVARLVQLALLPVLLALTVNLEFTVALRPFFDLQPTAQQLRELEDGGHSVAVYARYDGEFDLIGRLRTPPVVLKDMPAALAWAAAHRDGIIVSFFRGGILHLPEQPLYLGHAEDYRAALWPSKAVVDSNGAVLNSRF